MLGGLGGGNGDERVRGDRGGRDPRLEKRETWGTRRSLTSFGMTNSLKMRKENIPRHSLTSAAKGVRIYRPNRSGEPPRHANAELMSS